MLPLLIQPTTGTSWEMELTSAVALGLGLHQLWRLLKKRSGPKQPKDFKKFLYIALLTLAIIVVFGLVTITAMVGFAIPLAGFFAAALATVCAILSVLLVVAGIIGLLSLMGRLMENAFDDGKSFGGMFLSVLLLLALAVAVFAALGGLANIIFFGLFLSLKLPFLLAALTSLKMFGVLFAGLTTCFGVNALFRRK